MSQIKLQMNLPLDDSGFLRRECPHCQRQFKWITSQPQADEKSPQIEVPMYFCPLCGVSAKADAWWTRDQIEHATAIAKARALGPMLNDFGAGLRRLNRPGSSIRITTNSVSYPEPTPLAPEPNDMRVVVPKCHPKEMVKVPEDWNQPVHCAICGVPTLVEGEKL